MYGSVHLLWKYHDICLFAWAQLGKRTSSESCFRSLPVTEFLRQIWSSLKRSLTAVLMLLPEVSNDVRMPEPKMSKKALQPCYEAERLFQSTFKTVKISHLASPVLTQRKSTKSAIFYISFKQSLSSFTSDTFNNNPIYFLSKLFSNRP